MTDEEWTKMQNTMQFIIEQQAQFSVDIQQLRESQAQTTDLIGRLAQVTTAGFQDLTEKVNIITDAQIKTEERMQALAEAQRHTDQQMAETNERLNALINTVERYVSEGRNGKA